MRLGLGPDAPLPRLLAAGTPDWIGADGVRVGWAVRDRLFLLGPDGVTVVALPEYVEEVAVSPAGWMVAFGNGFVRVDPTTGELLAAVVDDEKDPVGAWPGGDVGLFVEVPEHRLLRLADGQPLALPDAATRARWIRPWEAGFGACWVDMDTLYRLGARIEALGRAPGAEGIRCGPGGAVVVALKKDTVVAAARGAAMRVGLRLDPDSARFSPDGRSVLAASERGAHLVDLRDGSVVRTWEGSFGPVGFVQDVPILWDLDGGTLVDAEGDVRLDGFAAASPGVGGQLLAGPGGAVWDLARGHRLRADLRGGACATDGQRVVHVTGATLRIDDLPPLPHGLLTGPEDEVAGARIDGETVIVETLDGEQGVFSLHDGALISRAAVRAPRRPARVSPEGVVLPPEDEESTVEVHGRDWPLPADGAARSDAGVWLWTREGMLVEVPE